MVYSLGNLREKMIVSRFTHFKILKRAFYKVDKRILAEIRARNVIITTKVASKRRVNFQPRDVGYLRNLAGGGPIFVLFALFA